MTTTAERIQTLLEACLTLPTAHELFWFTTFDAVSLDAPAELLGSFWTTGKAEEPRGLLED